LVTGSGRNIGRAILLELAGHGANVIVNARSDKAETDAVAKEAEGLGARSLVVMGVRRRRHLRQQRSPPALQDFFTITDEDWHYYLNQQLTASWYLAKAFVPGMRDRGRAGWCISTGRTAGWAVDPGPPLGRQGRPAHPDQVSGLGAGPVRHHRQRRLPRLH
jgi:NAD(P)-dependent dehydrogenase (short-subunit alcohol dehydrogenase family)